MPVFSVVIPVFNAARTLPRCLDSLLQQDFSDFEVIVCDGVSTDGSLEIARQHPIGAHVSSQSDRGVYDAMNRGISLARGEWLLFLGADDHLANAAVLSEIIPYCGGEEQLVLGNAVFEDLKHSRVPGFYRSELTSRILWRNTIHHQSAFYHRSLFENAFYDMRFSVLADYHFNLHLHRAKIAWKHVDVTVAVCGGGGVSKNFNAGLYKEEWRLKREVLGWPMAVIQLPWLAMKFLWKNL
ncbi:MAG: glycosyltransferase [Flavobacteriales bacterium]|nr:glycosyltransferase [Flavobacteriales bacterium]